MHGQASGSEAHADPVASNDAVVRMRERLDAGAPWDACDAFREAIARWPSDGELLYWGALAHARAGALRTAHAILDRADAAIPPQRPRRPDLLSLRGRLWKDAFERASAAACAREPGDPARDESLRTFAIARDPYPGINAATLSMLLGDVQEAK